MTTYEKSFREEAARLSDDIGMKQAAAQLGIPYWTLADWRAARKAQESQAFVGRGTSDCPRMRRNGAYWNWRRRIPS